jgi:hypothetical protein
MSCGKFLRDNRSPVPATGRDCSGRSITTRMLADCDYPHKPGKPSRIKLQYKNKGTYKSLVSAFVVFGSLCRTEFELFLKIRPTDLSIN